MEIRCKAPRMSAASKSAHAAERKGRLRRRRSIAVREQLMIEEPSTTCRRARLTRQASQFQAFLSKKLSHLRACWQRSPWTGLGRPRQADTACKAARSRTLAKPE